LDRPLSYFFDTQNEIPRTLGLVLGLLPLTIPFVVVTVSSSLYGFDTPLEAAAQTVGDNRLKTFFLVTYSLIQPGVLAGALFAFIISFNEYFSEEKPCFKTMQK